MYYKHPLSFGAFCYNNFAFYKGIQLSLTWISSDVCRTSCYCREWKETNTEEMELFILFPLKAVSG